MERFTSSSSQLGVTLAFLRPLARALKPYGIASDQFLADLGAPVDDVLGGRVSLQVLGAALDRIAAEHSIPHLAIEIAARMPLGSLGLPDYGWNTSATLFDALLHGTSHVPVFADSFRYQLRVDGGNACISQEYLAPGYTPILVELTTALVARRIQDVLSITRAFTQIKFRHAAPASTLPYEMFFGITPTFGADEDAIVFGVERLSTPLITANAVIAGAIREHPMLAGAAQASGQPMLAFVKAKVTECFREGRQLTPITDLAKMLHVSSRSLQRRLREQGATYAELVDEIRRQEATSMLDSTKLPITQISRQLGFHDVTAFSRAFRRWNGISPRAYRKGRKESIPPVSGVTVRVTTVQVA